ncbi:hypothetical protein NMY22_g7040 [Coprinellus aureogranulatus]|nr:hypothetical protein NMY22_g7040 [Coprinellus aureogranulatus]
MSVLPTFESKQRGRFFLDSVTLEVEGVLHRIPKLYLESSSPLFKDMWSLPQGPDAEGQTEENPVVLTGCTNAEFENLLAVLVQGPTPSRLQKEEYLSALRLATMWDMSELRRVLIAKLDSLKLSVAEKIAFGKHYGVADWLVEGCTSAFAGSDHLDVDELAAYIGWEATARVALNFKPQPSRIVDIEPSLFRCEYCSELVSPDSHKTPYPTAVQCTACGRAIWIVSRPVRVDLADLGGESYEDCMQFVKEILADELKGME